MVVLGGGGSYEQGTPLEPVSGLEVGLELRGFSSLFAAPKRARPETRGDSGGGTERLILPRIVRCQW